MEALACPGCGGTVTEFDACCPACGASSPPRPLETMGPMATAAGATPAVTYPEVGGTVGRFRVLGLLGRGGMGTVFRALDLDLGREVALKFLAAGDLADTARLRGEAQALAALDHPNIGAIYDIGQHAGRPFLALALYDGETLAERLARGPLAPAEAALVAGQLAAALAAAHRAGLVHRDVKPANLILPAGAPARLLDFGLARRAAAAEPGGAGGTLAYMAPEVLRGEDSGPASDLWSFGVVLYEMLAGRRPFPAGEADLREAILRRDPVPLAELCPEAPAALARIVDRCLEKEPGDRYADAGELAAALAGVSAAAAGASPVAAPASGLRARRGRAAWVAGTAALAALALAVWAALHFGAAPLPLLHVAPFPPEVAGAEPRQRALLASNLQVATLRALSALERVSPLDPAQWKNVAGPPAALARATAADEVVTARADCADDLCQVVVSRLSGGDGSVLAAETLPVPISRPQLFAEAVAQAVRRTYRERRLRPGALEMAIDERGYREFLALRQGLTERTVEPRLALEELDALRQRAPAFLEAAALEASLCRFLYESTGDRGLLERGLAVARGAAERVPDDPRPAGSRFDLELAAGRLDAAAATLERLARLDPGSAALPLRQARLAEARGDREGAARRLEEAVARRPSWQHLLTLANLEYTLGRIGRARAHLEQLLGRSPGHLEAMRTLAQIELLNGDSRRALALLTEVTRRQPDTDALINLGLAQMLERRYPEAEQSLHRARELAPDNPQVALDLADVLFLSGRAAEAESLYRRVVTAAPAGVVAWARWSLEAQALAHLGERAAAVARIQRALERAPDSPQLAYEAALVFTLVGDQSSALYHAGHALDGGVGARWFDFPWFEPLRTDPGWASRLARAGAAPSRR